MSRQASERESGHTSNTTEASIVVTTDRARLDLDVIHGFLTRSYWAEGIPRETVARSMHPELQGLRRWTLATRDAHGLYRQFGFGEPAHPDRQMEILDRTPYHA